MLFQGQAKNNGVERIHKRLTMRARSGYGNRLCTLRCKSGKGGNEGHGSVVKWQFNDRTGGAMLIKSEYQRKLVETKSECVKQESKVC